MAFNDTIRILTTNDTNHADNFNDVYAQLLANTIYNRDKANTLLSKIDIASGAKLNGWQISADYASYIYKIGELKKLSAYFKVGTTTVFTPIVEFPTGFANVKASVHNFLHESGSKMGCFRIIANRLEYVSGTIALNDYIAVDILYY